MVTMRLLITLFMLAFAQLFFNMAHASPHAPINANHHKADSSTPAREDERRKRRPVKANSTKKVKESTSKRSRLTSVQKLKLKKKPSLQTASVQTAPLHSSKYKKKTTLNAGKNAMAAIVARLLILLKS